MFGLPPFGLIDALGYNEVHIVMMRGSDGEAEVDNVFSTLGDANTHVAEWADDLETTITFDFDGSARFDNGSHEDFDIREMWVKSRKVDPFDEVEAKGESA